MASLRELMRLRQLQDLYVKRHEGELASAMARQRVASKSHEHASNQLRQACKELDETIGRSSIPLDRLMLRSARVSQLDLETKAKLEDKVAAETDETRARTEWHLAQCRAGDLTERSRSAARKEQDRADTSREREALDLYVLKGASRQ